jgi:hypothetical protein
LAIGTRYRRKRTTLGRATISGRNEVHVQFACPYPTQVETKFWRIVTSSLWRRGGSKYLAESWSRETGGCTDPVVRGTTANADAIVKAEMHVRRKKMLQR